MPHPHQPPGRPVAKESWTSTNCSIIDTLVNEACCAVGHGNLLPDGWCAFWPSNDFGLHNYTMCVQDTAKGNRTFDKLVPWSQRQREAMCFAAPGAISREAYLVVVIAALFIGVPLVFALIIGFVRGGDHGGGLRGTALRGVDAVRGVGDVAMRGVRFVERTVLGRGGPKYDRLEAEDYELTMGEVRRG